jgi:hypothetical protein
MSPVKITAQLQLSWAVFHPPHQLHYAQILRRAEEELILDNAEAVVLVAPNNEKQSLFTTIISEATALLLFLALVGRQRQLQV